MKTCNLIATIKVRWWIYPYLRGVALMCKITGKQPDYDKVAYWVEKAVKISSIQTQRV